MKPLAFWTDGPPLTGNAPGNHGIARHMIDGLRGSLACVVTHRYNRKHARPDIRAAAGGVPVEFYPDSRPCGIRRFAPRLAVLTDLVLFLAWLPLLLFRLHRRGVERVLVLFGADLWFPLHVWIFQKCSGLPVDVYLVDDIEASASHGPDEKFVDLGRAILAATLRASDRVFAISPGFCEHLESRFGVAVEWLPVPSSITPPEHVPEDAASDKRYLVFVGALNHLYVDALRDLYEVISLRNAAARPGEAPMLLELLTYSEPARFLDSLPDRKWVEVHENLPEPERMRRLGRAHACFLPYSFLESGRLMVTTSFSCKILEYFSCGRPILVYGPAYASIPRYFKECGLEICAVDRSELPAALDSIAAHDGPELIRSYRTAWETRHSGEALRRIVVDALALA